MPAEKYSYIPSAPGGKFDGVRSFAEQVKHVACANFAFFNEIEGKTPPDSCEKGGPASAASKAELLKYLRDSFDYGNKVLTTINEKNAMDRAEGRYGGPNTKLGMAVIAVWHIADHYGQIVYYLRLNGIVPPPTQRQGLQVRSTGAHRLRDAGLHGGPVRATAFAVPGKASPRRCQCHRNSRRQN